MSDIEIRRVPTKQPTGTAVLLEIIYRGGVFYITCSYDPPFDGESIFTDRHRVGYGFSRESLEEVAGMAAFARGYRLVIPDDYLWEDR